MSGKVLRLLLFAFALTVAGATAAAAQSTTPTTKPGGGTVSPGFGFAGAPAFQAPSVKTPTAGAASTNLPTAQPAALSSAAAVPAITSSAAAPAAVTPAVPARTGAGSVQMFAAALAVLALGFLVSLYARPVGSHAAGRRGVAGYYIRNWREVGYRPRPRRRR